MRDCHQQSGTTQVRCQGSIFVQHSTGSVPDLNIVWYGTGTTVKIPEKIWYSLGTGNPDISAVIHLSAGIGPLEKFKSS